MVKPRRQHDELRAEIIAFAEAVIRSEGVGGLNARDLASYANVSVGTLYNLFGHLDGVVRAVNIQNMESLKIALMTALSASEPSLEDRLIAMALAYLAFAKADPRRWEAMFHYRLKTPGEPANLEAKNDLFTLLKETVGAGEDPTVLLALWAAVHGVAELAVTERMAGMESQDMEGYVRLIVRAGLRGVQAMRASGEM
ncbi:MAG: TetR/AcrR family transcriptional regulator [Pseudomonadota bacterium]